MFNLENECHVQLEHMVEIPIRHKHSEYINIIKFNKTTFVDYYLDSKSNARPKYEKFRASQKNDRCWVCKRGNFKGPLVHCYYCSRLYHLNCLDPPICDWDESTRWICPAHKKYYVRYFC